MVTVTTFGIQRPSNAHRRFDPGALVSGVLDGQAVVALACEDPTGHFFIVLNGDDGPLLAGESQLSYSREIDGELIIEPSDGVPAFALPVAEGRQNGCLVTTDAGEVGIRLVVPNTPQPFIVMQDFATGQCIKGSPRFLLSKFRLLLKVEGRDKPLFLSEFTREK